MRLAQTEVYEVATFYHHFDVVKEGETPPPALTVRVCDSIACELAGAEELLKKLSRWGRTSGCCTRRASGAAKSRPAWWWDRTPSAMRRWKRFKKAVSSGKTDSL